MRHSWYFLNNISISDLTRIQTLLSRQGVYYSILEDEVYKDNFYRYIASLMFPDREEVVSYFDFIAYWCDVWNIQLSDNLQILEDEILLKIFVEAVKGMDSRSFTNLAKYLDVTSNSKKQLISDVITRHRSSDSYKDNFPQLLLDSKLFEHFSLDRPIYELMCIIIKNRWIEIKPMSEDDARLFILDYIKKSDNDLTDYETSCQVLTILINEVMELNRDVVAELQKIEKIPSCSMPHNILKKLHPHTPTLVDMIMRRIAGKSDEEIDAFQKANELCNGKDSILFDEYCFPYTIVDRHCNYIQKANKYANAIYLYYKLGISYNDYYMEKENLSKYDIIICRSKDENFYQEYGKTYTIDNTSSPYIKYDEISQELLPFFSMPINELKSAIVKSESVKSFAKILKQIYILREQINLSDLSMRRLRHDYSANLGIIHDYIHSFSDADPLEKKAASDSYDILSKAIKDIGKDTQKEYVNLYDVITEYIKKDKMNGDKYYIEFNTDGINKAESYIFRDVFCTSVLNNIITNAFKHGFTIDRPNVKNRILIALSDDGDSWLISIKNNGRSYAGDEERIFEQGYKAGPTGHKGEGMNNAYSSLLSMGGHLSFKSIPEAEYPVVFTINLPKTNE